MFKKIISRIARALSKKKIPYMIIGGQAVLLYGEPRLTRDIDITLGVDIEKLPAIVELAREIGLSILVPDYQKFVTQTMVLPTGDKNSGIRVDFIFSFTPYEQQAIKRAKRIVIGKARVRFASIEDVIIHKIFAGRPLDMEDVRSIIIRNKEIDTGYIRRWLKLFEETGEGKYCLLKKFEQIYRDEKGKDKK